MEGVSLKSIVLIPKTVLFRQDNKGKLSIIEVNSSVIYSLTDLSALVFASFDGKKNLKAITEKIAQQENVPLKRLQNDTLKLVKQLNKENLVKIK